jgi:hypothetical protein
VSKPLKTLVVMIGALALTAFLFRNGNGDSSTWIGVAVAMGIIFAAMFVPAIGDFIVANPKTVFRSGIAIVVGGLISPIVFFATLGHAPESGKNDPMMWVMVYAMMIGICLTILPRSIAAQRRTQPALERMETATKIPRDDQFRGIEQGWRANLQTLRHIGPLLRIAGPWIAIIVAANLAGSHLDELWPQYSGEFQLRPWTGALLSVSMAIGIPTALVAWHRHLLEDQPPRFARPNKRVFRYWWRLWLTVFASGALVRVAALNAPDVARLVGTANVGAIFEVLYWGTLALVLLFGNKFALVFPAVALGQLDFAGMDSLVMTKPLGNAFGVGFVLSLLPWGAFGYLADVILVRMAVEGRGDLGVLTNVTLFIMTVSGFLALASCATYLSNVYAELNGRAGESGET